MLDTFTSGPKTPFRNKQHKLSHTDRVVLWWPANIYNFCHFQQIPRNRSINFQEVEDPRILAVLTNTLEQKIWAESRTSFAKTCAGYRSRESRYLSDLILGSDIRGSVQLVPDSLPCPLSPFWGGERGYVGVIGLEKNERKAIGASKAFSLIRLYLEVKRLNTLTHVEAGVPLQYNLCWWVRKEVSRL